MKKNMTDIQREIVRAYFKSPSLLVAAVKLGVSKQRVHQVVRECAPELMQPAHKRSERRA